VFVAFGLAIAVSECMALVAKAGETPLPIGDKAGNKANAKVTKVANERRKKEDMTRE
jgi:hypothetical protein